MRIGIDARMLGSGFGLARYVQQLVLGLQKYDKENEYVLFMRQDNWEEFQPINNHFTKILADFHWYSCEEQLKFSKVIKRANVDLMHFPHWNVPLLYSKPFVVTVHDLIMFRFPRPEATTLGPIKFWIKDQAHRLVLRMAVKKAKQVVTTSEFTRYDLKTLLSLDSEKITVIYQAPFKSNMINELSQEELKKKYNINKPFVLCVGSAYPHKNLDGLLKAWQGADILKQEYQLVLVGKKDYFYQHLQSSEIAQRLGNSIVFTGLVSDKELAGLYKHSKAYVFPSKYEGFGLPPLEAMQYGIPVISSNSSCLPEILGEAAIYFDPDNYQQMGELILKTLVNQDWRFELAQKGRENLQRFSLNKQILQTLSVYRAACKWR